MKMITVYGNGKTFDNGAIEEISIIDGSTVRYGKGLVNNDSDRENIKAALELALPRYFGAIAQGVTGKSFDLLADVSEALADYYTFIDIDTTQVDVTEVIVLMTKADFIFSEVTQTFVDAGWQVLVSPINARSESPYKIKVTLINPVQPVLFTEN